MPRKNQKTDVFKSIDMRGGDTEQCWPWIGGSVGGKEGNKRGYFQYDGVRHLAYRVVFELAHNVTLGADDYIRHKCDNPMCCNPTHLLKGTLTQNQEDRVHRNRNVGRFTMDQARLIRKMYHEDNETVQQLANKFGCSHTIISRIINNKAYKERTDEY